MCDEIVGKTLDEAKEMAKIYIGMIKREDISDEDLVNVANTVQAAYEKLKQEDEQFSLVTFEYEVAMAFVYFEQKQCDYAVIEVGIGGEHDKTNVIIPEVSIITTIGLDHEKIIGPTIQDITQEKSGIIKQNRPVVLGNVPDSVLSILVKKADKMHAPLLQLKHDFTIETQNGRLKYSDAKRSLSFAYRPQVEGYDIAVAVKAFLLLKLNLNDQEIEDAINQTQIPGRYHILQKEPLIILDGAHNIQAMSNLLEVVHAEAKKRHSHVYALMTMMKDKDLEQVFSLFNKDDQVLLTTLDYPRVAKENDFPIDVQRRYNYEGDYRQGFTKLKEKMDASDILLVTGSFYLVSAILSWKGKGNAG